MEKKVKLNMLKGLACIGVLFIHISFPGTFGLVIARLSLFGVPIFFMISGYFAFDANPEIIKHRLFKILKIFFFSYVLYLLFGTLQAYIYQEGLDGLVDRFKLDVYTPVKYILHSRKRDDVILVMNSEKPLKY